MSHRLTRREFVTVAGGAALAAGGLSEAARHARGAEALAGLDEFCRKAIAEWQVPGLALAVIGDGKLQLARGYGVRELGKGAPVTEDTVFSIASCTKSFTAAMLARLVDTGQLGWDDPLRKHLPEIILPTTAPGLEPSIRHALQHRTGLPTANMLWRSGEFGADEILRRVRWLTPMAAPGARMVYNNVMYLAAGKAAEHACGMPWGDFLRAEFFAPLGMTSTVTDSTQLATFDNLAAPHAPIEGKVQPITRYCPDVLGPAGTIHSTAVDMARWLILHLDRGRLGGRELLSAARVDEMHAPVEPTQAELSSKGGPKAPISRYGLGWFVNEHAAETVVEHSGTQTGFVSWMALMPKKRLGVVILSNHHQTGLNYALRSWIFDRLLRRPEYDWISAIRADQSQGWRRLLREARAEFDARRPADLPPSRPLAEYAGDYESRLYGTIHVIAGEGQLKLKFGTHFHGDLKPWHGETFRAFFPNPRLDDWQVAFAISDGRVASLKVQEAPWAPQWYDDRDDLGEFVRKQERP
ncbi:MAG: serine hydrolase [Planctomycetia bacterium]|nr:serine hydrolase [Planctomycetia bacterium]